jgi:GNAT superfamily N-acetyltransferase
MTDVQHRSAPPDSIATAGSRVTVRPYRPSDHGACRGLWAELTEHRSRLYGRRPHESDAGSGFEEYLTQLNLSGMWVADEGDEQVVGFVGVMLDGRAGEVDPIVVTAAMRGRGIGRAMLATVVGEARRRGLTRLTVSPPTRDESALRALHVAGFSTLASVTVSYDLRERSAGAANVAGATTESTLDLFDLRFDV